MVVAYRKATIGLADEVVHLDGGRVADRGTHRELLGRSPDYARLVNAYEQAAHDDAAAPVPPSRAAPEAPSEHHAHDQDHHAAVAGTRMDSGEEIGAIETIRRGMRISPELREGLGFTLFLAIVAACGQVVVPVAVQQTLDRGLNGPDGPRLDYVVWLGIGCAVALAVTSLASYTMTSRLFTTSERGLATLRVKAFRHVHDLPLLTQNTERRGALVSRVTSDVDQVSQFLVFGGLIFVVSIGQILVATVIMVIYSWQLALVVWLCFAPLFVSIRYFQRKLSEAYGVVRHQVGVLLRRHLRAGRRRRHRPLVRRRGAHPGPDRHRDRRVQDAPAPGRRSSRSCRSRSAASPPASPTPACWSSACSWASPPT